MSRCSAACLQLRTRDRDLVGLLRGRTNQVSAAVLPWILADEAAVFTLAWFWPLWICCKASATFSEGETLT